MLRPESITSEWYYKFVVARIEQLQHAEPDTPESEELKRLTELLVEYETRMAALQQPAHQSPHKP